MAAMKNSGLEGLFEDHLTTDRVKAFKPDPRAYQMGVDAFGLKKEEIAFAAFAGWDVAGAKWFGYPTFWVNRADAPLEELGVVPDGIGPVWTISCHLSAAAESLYRGADSFLRLERPRQQTFDRSVDGHLAAQIAATAFDTGISTFCEAASSIRTGAVNSPSASLPCGFGSPRPSAMPSAKLRDCRLEQLRTRSPRPG